MVAGGVHRWCRPRVRGADPAARRRGPGRRGPGCSTSGVARARWPGALAGRGAATVVGVDPSRAQLAVAVQRAGGPIYIRAAAAALPFAGGRFDAVVACLVFEHIREVDAAIAEVGPDAAPRRPVRLLPQPPAVAGAEQRMDRRQRSSIRPSSTGASGRTSSRTSRSSRWRRACSSRSSTGPCRGTSTPWRPTVWSSFGWMSRRRPPASWPGRPSTRRRPRYLVSCSWSPRRGRSQALALLGASVFWAR